MYIIHIYICLSISIQIYFFRFCSLIGYYKILNIVPCAIQQVLVVYQFIYGCVYTLIPTSYFFLFPLCPLVTMAMSVSLFLFVCVCVFYFIIIIILFYNIVLVLPYISMNPPWVYMFICIIF